MLSKLFDWWFDQKILMFECSEHNIEKIVLKEFEMHKHHLRRINQRENNDWLRNMFYFIDQQLMRQNSLYYRWYVKLQFDKCWKLINYLYYEKYVMQKNNIFFRHIDQNISQLISFVCLFVFLIHTSFRSHVRACEEYLKWFFTSSVHDKNKKIMIV
jgi:hypothetical protein